MKERTSFLGRDAELARLASLHDGGATLVTVWGPAGAGKSRLVRRFVARLGAGAVVVPLAAARGGPDVVEAAARVLGADASLDAVGRALAARGDAVVVLDDVERSLAGGGAAVVAAWRDVAPEARFVVTSREPLGLDGEERIEVTPLPIEEATALFFDRASTVRGAPLPPTEVSSRAARAIVARTGGLPLAIELAAAQCDVASPEQIAARLSSHAPLLDLAASRRDVEPRHASLRAAIDGSWQTASAEERRALVRAVVFVDGFTSEAADAVTGAMGAMERLRRRSLVHVRDDDEGAIRLDLSEPVRAFASEQLDPRERREAERAHAAWLVQFAEAQAMKLGGPDEADALARLGAESANLVAAMRRADAADRARLLIAAHELLLARGPFGEHLALLDAAIAEQPAVATSRDDDATAASRDDDATAASRDEGVTDATGAVEGAIGRPVDALRTARAEVRRQRGMLDAARDDLVACRESARTTRLRGTVDRMQGRLDDAKACVERAVALAAGDRVAEALALGELGAIASAFGDLESARIHHARALDILRRCGGPRARGVQLSWLAVVTHRLGLLDEARAMHEEALALHRAAQNRRYEAAELSHIGYVASELDDDGAARAAYAAALGMAREVGDRALEAIVLTYAAPLEAEAGALLAAAAHLEEALAVHRANGARRLEGVTHVHRGHVYDAHGDSAAAARAYEDGRAALRGVDAAAEALAATWASGAAVADASRRRAGLGRAPRRTGTLAALTIGAGATWFAIGDAPRVDLSRRRALRLVFAALAARRRVSPGAGLAWHELQAAGWPGERMRDDAGLKRVYTAVWTLRKLGLESLLVTRDEGYLLDPTVAVHFEEL